MDLPVIPWLCVKKNVDNVVDTLSRTMVEIDLAKPKRRISDPDKLNAFLKRFETTVGPYKISFHASQDENGQFTRDGSFVSDITYKNGDRIKGSVCRKLITKMAEQKFASDVSFTLEDEGVTVELNGKVVNLDDLCGG